MNQLEFDFPVYAGHTWYIAKVATDEQGEDLYALQLFDLSGVKAYESGQIYGKFMTPDSLREMANSLLSTIVRDKERDTFLTVIGDKAIIV